MHSDNKLIQIFIKFIISSFVKTLGTKASLLDKSFLLHFFSVEQNFTIYVTIILKSKAAAQSIDSSRIFSIIFQRFGKLNSFAPVIQLK